MGRLAVSSGHVCMVDAMVGSICGHEWLSVVLMMLMTVTEECNSLLR